jgi:hypothetical protein
MKSQLLSVIYRRNSMKKFEVVFNDSNYDYVTKNMVLEYLKSAFTKAEIQVKTIPQKKKKEVQYGR